MIATEIDKGRTLKSVRVEDLAGETDEQIATFAMRMAGEDRSSLFGHKVQRFPVENAARVSLFTD